jgi:hypothetical protein
MIAPASEKWLSPREAAEALPGGGCPAKIVRWFTVGLLVDGRRVRLACRRIGGRWYVKAADLEAFLAAVGAARGGQGIRPEAVWIGACRIATREALRRHRRAKCELIAAGVLDCQALTVPSLGASRD